MDSNLCIAYHTIENRGAVPSAVAERTGQWILGCDICQDVCPWNDPSPGRHFPLVNPAWGKPLAELATWSEAQFKESVRGLAVSRAKYPMFTRNVAIARCGG